MNIDRHWQRLSLLSVLLFPLSLLFRLLAALRRSLYQLGLRRVHRFTVPLIVVGNITVGGSGKTPLVVWLIKHLKSLGLKPGVVSRGYGGKAVHWPQQVRPDSDPVAVGDEAVLLAQSGQCPVCVGPDRPEVVRALLQHADCDIVISDDGLQHYPMGRDIEIAVIDGQRRFGNGLLLPAGPLREPVSRLKSVDLVIANGKAAHGEHCMQLNQPMIYPSHDENAPALPLADWSGRRVHALAGIGHPQRFFDMLKKAGLVVTEHAFPDHHAYAADDLSFDEPLPLLMTEKDAVKCRRFCTVDTWVVGISAKPDAAFEHRLSLLLKPLLPAAGNTTEMSDGQ